MSDGAKVRIKCPECGLVQWKQEACRRCGTPFAPATLPAAQAAAPPPPSPAAVAAAGPQPSFEDWQAPSVPAAPPQASPPGDVYEPNLYAPPTAAVTAAGYAGASVGRFGEITEDIVVTQEKSARWMSYTSIVSYLLAVIYAFVGLATGSFLSEEGNAGTAVMLLYFLMAGIVFVIAHHLRGASREAKGIRESTNPSMTLADSLQHQAYFWRITGGLSAISLALIGAGLLFAVFGGILASAG